MPGPGRQKKGTGLIRSVPWRRVAGVLVPGPDVHYRPGASGDGDCPVCLSDEGDGPAILDARGEEFLRLRVLGGVADDGVVVVLDIVSGVPDDVAVDVLCVRRQEDVLLGEKPG